MGRNTEKVNVRSIIIVQFHYVNHFLIDTARVATFFVYLFAVYSLNSIIDREERKKEPDRDA